MESLKDANSEVGESEDLPSDFFDDFSKDEFMEGLSVIDECWDDASAIPSQIRDPRGRISEVLDSVKDLRELIGENNEEEMISRKSKKKKYPVVNSKYRWRNPELPAPTKPSIKPGSRRDPSKTNEAIKKDKEVKVQQFLAKSLESSDDLRPPGTELDDYYDEEKTNKDSSQPKSSKEQSPIRTRRSPRSRLSPPQRFSPHEGTRHFNRQLSPTLRQRYVAKKFSPHHPVRRNYSPHRRSPGRRSPPRRSPVRNSPQRRSPLRHRPYRRSPGRHSPHRRSPGRHSPHRRSPRRYSPARRSPRRHRSRSPRSRLESRRSRSRSPRRDDSFLYPNPSLDTTSGYPLGNPPYQPELGQEYTPQVHTEFPGSVPGYSYPQMPAYGGGFPDPYNYGGAPVQPTMSAPGLMPNVNPVPAPTMLNPVAAPPMVPAPAAPSTDQATPYDALAQLVAEGKISQEDYLKLTPNKGQATTMDTKTRVMAAFVVCAIFIYAGAGGSKWCYFVFAVLTRCNQALAKLDKLLLPNRLMLDTQTIGAEEKYLAPKYCSPLKRQAITEFSFTKGSVNPTQHTKQLVESIISTLGLNKIVSKYKKKIPKDMKDAVIQTTRPACEVCEIRESTKYHDVGTSTEPEYFTSTVHTQVVEQDLVNSKTIFNPSGSVGDGAPISIAHLTPAQLVSQLAARAKTLKQPQEPSPQQQQFGRRPPPNYEYDGRGQQYHPSYNNYRY